MRYSTTTALIAVSSLALLACSSFTNNNNAFVSAALTPEERLETEARDPTNPNYCPDCLKKALVNHFPHACPPDLQPMVAITRPSGPTPAERRCICVAFLDLFWMKTDCSSECAFVHDADAMGHLMTAKSIPGCEQFVDFETNTELELDGFAKKDPNHMPEVFDQATQEEAQEAEAVAAAAREKKEAEAAAERAALEAEREAKEAAEQEMRGENEGPKLTINMDNFIRNNSDGSIPEGISAELIAEARAEMARAEAARVEVHAAKVKANVEAEAAAAAEAVEAESDSKAKDEL
ncbi:hypothetical protein BGW39_001946 [Mortierella sp. 14UC]|nr:hypothetical protein BGW39_001946 [Mortierella sp. 14UC]